MPKKQTQQQPKSKGSNTEKQPAGVTFVRSADFKPIYTNFARVNFNAFEVSVLFGHAAVMPEQQEKVAVEMTTRVTMSAVEAKLLIQMMTTVMAGFEKKYGQVVIPDDVKLPLDGKVDGV
jgi:hypothetical protein